MKSIFLSVPLGLLASFASAAQWEKAGTVEGYYYFAPDVKQGILGERGLSIGEAMAGENAIVAAHFYKNSENIFCNVYEYAGELQETFVFSYWEGMVSKAKDQSANFEALANARKNEDKASIALFSTLICDEVKSKPHRNIYVPSRFAELYLPGVFRDTSVKLTRVRGAATLVELR